MSNNRVPSTVPDDVYQEYKRISGVIDHARLGSNEYYGAVEARKMLTEGLTNDQMGNIQNRLMVEYLENPKPKVGV